MGWPADPRCCVGGADDVRGPDATRWRSGRQRRSQRLMISRCSGRGGQGTSGGRGGLLRFTSRPLSMTRWVGDHPPKSGGGDRRFDLPGRECCNVGRGCGGTTMLYPGEGSRDLDDVRYPEARLVRPGMVTASCSSTMTRPTPGRRSWRAACCVKLVEEVVPRSGRATNVGCPPGHPRVPTLTRDLLDRGPGQIVRPVSREQRWRRAGEVRPG